MTMKPDGGKAFPIAGTSQIGMTLRQYYIGQAVIGLLANERWCQGLDKEAVKQGVDFKTALAVSAVELADKLIAEG